MRFVFLLLCSRAAAGAVIGIDMGAGEAWKAIGDEDPRRGIPTTYYGAVQLMGSATVADDHDSIAAALRTQLGDLEPDADLIDPIEHGKSLNAIRGLRIEIDDVRAKFKYGGNVDQAHRDAIANELRRRNGPGDHAALRHLQQR